MKTLPPVHRIALLFNGSKIYDRGIITGIGNYLSSTRASWDLFLEEDFLCRLRGIERWQGDGIIADFDDPLIGEALAGSRIPVVAVGGSYEDVSAYPKGIPYVATDNHALMKLAYEHLIEAGLTRFACFSLPEAQANRWAQEREKAFRGLVQRDGLPVEIYRGLGTSAPLWDSAVEQQIAWLHSLPKPIGIIAVTDARARQLLQACLTAGIAVPEEVALIGIDNDPLTRTLTRVPLSSVIQGTETMGRTAAALLHQMLHGKPCTGTQVLVPPDAINVQASSLHQPLGNPYVMQALLFIRQYACQGIKTDQVAAYVGVSRSSLEAHFRKVRGCSVHDEILRFKLAAAAKGLENQDLAIADIAARCGFTSAQYLHTVFRREFGCTPRQYQQGMPVAAPVACLPA
ncbi:MULTISPECIES: XylR family transcriptional regulator [Pseudomonas]|uniref:XylR family transcriptional regulator n=1 Tax=Pseudomonas synxantha TaxID=47883 RepID=A0A5D3G5E5_9PSED|nr:MULTISPECIES: XylR family transcriptional regulator [Pseudomonas]MCK3827838.1 xylose operon transcription regulator XylR [Pseudomonas sp. W2Aug9]MCK3854136.1 xylose operon transcription regulator XylR [Pseudomonas sp. W2Jun17]TYK55340.1 XylR family transcriptional regulator [Pseudomonas synxantha]UEH10504.1 XylR family transcriptional regulator [Pseudomonas sp. HN8-3]